MLIQLDPTIHNNTKPEKSPFVTYITFKNGTVFKGVVQYSTITKLLSIMLIEPYHIDMMKTHYITLIRNWYRDGPKEPIQIMFDRLQLKYLSLNQFNTFSLVNVTSIDGYVFCFDNGPKTKTAKEGNYKYLRKLSKIESELGIR